MALQLSGCEELNGFSWLSLQPHGYNFLSIVNASCISLPFCSMMSSNSSGVRVSTSSTRLRVTKL
jgi:hypothetical protein